MDGCLEHVEINALEFHFASQLELISDLFWRLKAQMNWFICGSILGSFWVLDLQGV